MSEQLLLLEAPPPTWHSADAAWLDAAAGEAPLLLAALRRAVAAGWYRLGPQRWARPYTPPSRLWIPGGELVVDWQDHTCMELTYRAPVTVRIRPLARWAYCWTDTITVRSVRSALRVLAALDLLGGAT